MSQSQIRLTSMFANEIEKKWNTKESATFYLYFYARACQFFFMVALLIILKNQKQFTEMDFIVCTLKVHRINYSDKILGGMLKKCTNQPKLGSLESKDESWIVAVIC